MEEQKISEKSNPFTISNNFDNSIYLLQYENNNLSCLSEFEKVHSDLITSHKFY